MPDFDFELPAACTILIVEDEYIIANDLELILQQAAHPVLGVADSVAEARALLARQRPDMVLLDIYLRGKQTGIELAGDLEEAGIPFIYVSANDNKSVLEAVKATQPSGYIVKPFRAKDILMTLEISRYRHAHSLEAKLREEKTLQTSLIQALTGPGTREQNLLQAAVLLQPHLPFDLLVVRCRTPAASGIHHFYRVGFAEYQILSPADLPALTQTAPEPLRALQDGPLPPAAARYPAAADPGVGQADPYGHLLAQKLRLHSALAMPLRTGAADAFGLTLLSRPPAAYQPRHLALLERLEQPIGLMLSYALAREAAPLPDEPRLAELPSGGAELAPGPAGIIGGSAALRRVLQQLSQVAPTDATVLILGESGTGKELIAKAVHESSARHGKPLVTLNCAALPATLIESELFGHEKGAFTGALERRLGKFELAQGGTLFLDEIGELPLELQAKLLRVLQEKEIERLGGQAPVRVDVRIVAATNRDLEKEVALGRFLMDLYFRLALFPLALPPLRERPDDVPLLARHLVRQVARKLGRPAPELGEALLGELRRYAWPGNIRELENVLEQALIMHDGRSPLALARPLGSSLLGGSPPAPATFAFGSVPTSSSADPVPAAPAAADIPPDLRQRQQQTERAHIVAALQQASGRIRGQGGAAELLGLKPTTLEYRMEKLGIRKTITVGPPPESA